MTTKVTITREPSSHNDVHVKIMSVADDGTGESNGYPDVVLTKESPTVALYVYSTQSLLIEEAP